MKLLVSAVTAALVLVSTASSASDFTLRPIAKTATTMTFSWARQPGADGYLFLRDGIPVARTMNPTTTRATFWKGSRYAVDVLHVAKGGRFTRGPRAVYAPHQVVARKRTARLVFVPAPSPTFSLRVVDRTSKTVTFAWAQQPGADGYQFVRDGSVVARTMNRSATTATFWKGSRYAVDELRSAPGTDNVVIPIRRAVAVRSTIAGKGPATRSGLVFRPAPKIDFRLRLGRQTKRTVTFTWKRQPKADGYRYLRDGVAVAQTFDRSATSATFSKGRRYAVEVLRFAPGKRVTAVMRALAFTTASTGRTSGEIPGEGSAASERATPTSPGVAGPPAKAPGSTNNAPKPSPAAPKPATPPASASPPAPRPAPAPSAPAVGPGGAVSLSGSYSPSAFFQALAVAPPGPTTVRGSFTVTGDLSINRPGLRIDGATVQGTVEFESGASGSAFANGNAEGFDVRGADNITIEGSTFDGACRRAQNWVIEEPAGRVPSGTTIRGNTFRNYYICADSDVHTEALFIAYSNGGLIEGNTFEDNGTTAHVFFSYVGANGSLDTGNYARNWCVRSNRFVRSKNPWYSIQFRPEIPASANTNVDPVSNTSDRALVGPTTAEAAAHTQRC